MLWFTCTSRRLTIVPSRAPRVWCSCHRADGTHEPWRGARWLVASQCRATSDAEVEPQGTMEVYHETDTGRGQRRDPGAHGVDGNRTRELGDTELPGLGARHALSSRLSRPGAARHRSAGRGRGPRESPGGPGSG